MAPLPPYQLTTALTVTGGVLGTPAVSMPSNMAQPVATGWNNDFPVSTHWAGAKPTPTNEHGGFVTILVARTEPEPTESDVEYVDESTSSVEGDGVDTGDGTGVDETSIDDDNGDDWETGDDDLGDEIIVENSDDDEDVIYETSDDNDDGLQTIDDDNSDETTDDGDSEIVDDDSEPDQIVGTEDSAETIASDLQEKYGNMPTSIDDCLDTNDEIVTYTDDNGNILETVNCTALANMETWYFLPCDDDCQRDLKKIIPGAVVESGVAGGLLPTILNNRGLWSSNPVTQTAVAEWLTRQLQQVRSRLTTDWFDWSSVRRNIKELLDHPPVDTPVEGDPFGDDPFGDDPFEDDPFESDPVESDPVESEPVEGDPPANTPYDDPLGSDPLREAELEVQEARNALENVKRMTKNEDAIRSAEEHLAEKEEVLRRVRETNPPPEVPNEEIIPEDPMQPPTSLPEQIASMQRKLDNALERVRYTLKKWQEVKDNPAIRPWEQEQRRDQWLKARKNLKKVRKEIRDRGLPVDDPGAADPSAPDAGPARPTKPIDPEEVAKAQKRVDKLQEIADKDAQRVRELEEEIRNTLHNRPDASSPEAVEAYEKSLQNLQNMKQTRLEHLTKLRKQLKVADRALKKAKGELRVTFPDDPVNGEQPNPYDVDGPNDDDDGDWEDVDENVDDDGEWEDVDENVDGDDAPEGEEPSEVDEPNDGPNNVDGSNDPDEWDDVDENPDGDTETNEPIDPDSTETYEPDEVDEPEGVDEDPESEDSPDGDDSDDFDVPASPEGAPVPPGEVPPPVAPPVPPPFPPVVVSIPDYGDVTALSKGMQYAAEAFKDAAQVLWDLMHSKKKDHKAIEKQKKKVEEKKKKLKKEEKEAKKEEKERKEQEKKKKEQKKHDKEQKEQEEKKAKEDKKKAHSSTTTRSSATSTSTTSSTTKTKAPEPTVHHKQHDAEITFHGKHSHKFELYGKDWARGKHDAEELHNNMESCGIKIKDWEFLYAADKPEIKTSDWSFYAKGELLRKTAEDVRCLNEVIEKANGPANLISETEGVDKAEETDKTDTDNAEAAAQITFTDKHQFTFYGKGFAKDKDAGEQMKEKFAKCSKVEDWKFYTQKKDHDMQLKKQGWDFYAEGKVKKIKRKCLNEVIQGMGGPMEAIAEDAV